MCKNDDERSCAYHNQSSETQQLHIHWPSLSRTALARTPAAVCLDEDTEAGVRDDDGVESLSPSRENTDDDDDAYIKHYNIIQAQLHAGFTK